MVFTEAGILSRSVRYLLTPSSLAERLLFYPTRIGHYFCQQTYHFRCDCEIAMQPDHHLHYMVFQIKEGALVLELEGRRYTAKPGDFVLFDCKQPHEYHAQNDFLEFYWMVFDGPMLDLFYRQILSMREGAHVFPSPDVGQFQLIFDRLLAQAALSSRRPEHIMAKLIYTMLCLLLAGTPENNTIIDQALAFMDQHFTEPLHVNEMAAQVGLSGSHFTKFFRQQTGYSPHEYIVLRRIDRAKELLLSTDQPVGQIAYEAGYHSEENFIRSFKKKVGVSPMAFRKYPV